MSIFFDFQVGPSGRRFRRAVDGDRYDIELILDSEHTEKLFGTVNIGSLIELSTLSICMINEAKDVVGFMALNDYPNVMGVDPADWEIWIRNMFQKFYVSRNTLFIHFMCCKDSVIQHFMSEALASVFQNDVYLLYIVLLVSAECPEENLARYQVFKKRNMCKYFARRDDDCEKKLHFLCTALRQDHCPRLKIRRAVEEDNDDICAILHKKSSDLKKLYGNYYISEIIGRHPESKRQIIVAEHQDRVVGVMCLSPNINYRKLQSIYNLRTLYGLRKATPLEKEQLKRSNVLLSAFGEPIMMGKKGPFDQQQYLSDIISEPSKDTLTQDTASTKGKVYFKQRASIDHCKNRKSNIADQHTIERHVYNISDDFSDRHLFISPTFSQTTNASMNLMLDGDPFEYDIVNIDVSLLTIADMYSSFEQMEQSFDASVQSRQSETPSVRKRRKRSIYKPVNANPNSEPFVYRGQPNAFMIELFGLRDDVDERSAIDFLEAAFQIMKEFDYCIIRVPSADASFPLLQHFCLVPIKTRMCCTYSLYVAHKASVMGKLRVREAEFIDIPQIARFFQSIQGKETIWTIENCISKRQDRHAYVFMSGLSLVGIGILEPPEKLNFLRTKFNMDQYHNHKYHEPGSGIKMGFSAVDVALAYSVFEPHFRFFAREMMRLSGSNSLVWMTAYRNKWVAHKANSLVATMVPLLPRKCNIDLASDPELAKISAIAKNIMAFCTWFMDKKMTSIPIVNVNTRIVVLGASRTALAFLNTLLFGNSSTYLSFTNITLVSANGLPYMRHSNPAVEMMFPKYHNNTDKYLKSVPYTYYVNVVQGIMVEINRIERYITLSNGSRYNYDMLFLLFGKQYQHPDYLKPLQEKDMKSENYVRQDIPRATFEPELKYYETPENVFIINNIGQANKALKYVKSCFQEDHNSKILVYGATIHTYCCLAALLEMNVPSENIVFVEPFPPEDPYKTRVSLFCNNNVDETVARVIDGLKIKVHRSYYFQSWKLFDNYVTHVNFLSYFQMVTIECAAFFYYGKRGVNTEAYIAVHKCGMTYDAGILIDHEFRTKDPAIYAAGPATAYYKRYRAPTMKQKYFDSYDVGETLANLIKSKLDPLFSDKYSPKAAASPKGSSEKFSTDSLYYVNSFNSPSTSSKSSSALSVEFDLSQNQLPNLLKPKIKYCQLPGELQYLEVRSPGKKIPHYYLQTLSYSGYVMETFKSGYFKIHMSNDLIVDGLTCLTRQKYSVENFKNIYGLSSVILNNIHLRYTTKKLDDFYEFFRLPWAFFLYHDQASELFAMVKELLPKGNSDGDTIREALRKVGTTRRSSDSFKVELRKKFEASAHVEAITDYVVEWISENDVLLPMYLQPSQRIDYEYDVDRNQVFRKKKLSIANLISKIL